MKSFTLIELLITISIISILSIFLIPNFHQVNSNMALERSAYKLARDLRGVEEMAMASKPFQASLFPSGGYGISFKYKDSKPNSYIIFADCNDNGEYEPGDPAVLSCADSKNANPHAYPELVQENFLEEGVTITNASPNLFEMTFLPPDPTVKISPAAVSASIELSAKGKTMSITINGVGVIEIQ